MASDAPAESPTPNQAPKLAAEIPTTGFEEYLEKHGKKTAALIALVVIAAAGWFFARAKSEGARREAGEAFSSAVTRSDLKGVAEKYAGTVSGGNALLLLADRQLDADQPKDAHATLNSFVADHSKHPLYYSGVFALACVDEQLGNFDAALAGFQTVAGAGAGVAPAALAAIRAADIRLRQGELEAARDAFGSIGAQYPASPFIPNSENRSQLAEHMITLRDHPAPPAEPEPEPEKPETPGTTPPAGDATTPPAGDATSPPAGDSAAGDESGTRTDGSDATAADSASSESATTPPGVE